MLMGLPSFLPWLAAALPQPLCVADGLRAVVVHQPDDDYLQPTVLPELCALIGFIRAAFALSPVLPLYEAADSP
jgi:hypothetical protein